MNKNHKKNGKSLAKSYGLKAVFAKDNKDLITTKKDTITLNVSSTIDGATYEYSKLDDSQKFDANIIKENNKQINIIPNNNNKKTQVNNPLYLPEGRKLGEDYLGIKDKLENYFFGKTFNDNIHIQIAYKLLDIKKIIGRYVNSAINSLDSLQTNKDNKLDDLIGTTCTTASFEENRQKDQYRVYIDTILNYSRYYDEVLERKKTSKDFSSSINRDLLNNSRRLRNNSSFIINKPTCFKVKFKPNDGFYVISHGNFKCGINTRIPLTVKAIIKINKGEIFKNNNGRFLLKNAQISSDIDKDINEYNLNTYEHNYNILRVISLFRQYSIHSNGIWDLWIYNITNFNQNNNTQINKTVDNIFKNSMAKFNDLFVRTNDKNILLILSLKYPERIRDKNDYNNFDKNIITKEINKYYEYVLYKEKDNIGISLRKIRENILSKYKENEIVQQYLTKIQILLDYFIYEYYFSNKGLVLKIKDDLTVCLNDEQREMVYQNISNKYFEENKLLIESIIEKTKKFITENIDNVIPNNYVNEKLNIDVSDFAKYLFVLTKFLDKKEVNDLLTNLINHFNNMHDLVNIASNNDNEQIFRQDLILLRNKSCKDIAKELILIKNLGVSKTKLKKVDVKDLETKVNPQIFLDAINMFSDKPFTNSDEEFKKLFNAESRSKEAKVRNFLINNVINNRRFYYLIKNFNVINCHKIIKNKYILECVFNESSFPESKLDKHCSSFGSCNSKNKHEKIEFIIKKIQELDFSKIIKWSDILSDNSATKSREVCKSLISLYLISCYLVVKNMVNINSIYYLAWSNFERDLNYLYSIDYERTNDLDYLKITEDFVNKKNCFKKRHRYMPYDIRDCKQKLIEINKIFREYRNKVSHLNICFDFANYLDGMGKVDSYYGIYNYCLQNMFAEEYNLEELKESLYKYHQYSRDYLKYFNMPFAYNMARYKNLTIEDLFNDKYPKEINAKKETSITK